MVLSFINVIIKITHIQFVSSNVLAVGSRVYQVLTYLSNDMFGYCTLINYQNRSPIDTHYSSFVCLCN